MVEILAQSPEAAGGQQQQQQQQRPQIGNDALMSVIKGGKNSLAQRLANAFIEKAAQKIDNEMTCKEHRNQSIVAFDCESNSFGCQQCIFEKDGFEESEFITLKARDIHDSFKQQYEKFQEVQFLLNQVQPQVVTQSIRIRVSQLFEKLKDQLDSVEVDVMNQIKQSTTLQQFLESAEKLQEEVNDNLIDYIEEENALVTDKICQSKFGYLVMKHNYYREVNDKFAVFNEMTEKEVERVKELEKRIIEFKKDQEAIITKSFREMLSQIIKIDGDKPVLVDQPDSAIENPEKAFKEGNVTESSALTFLMQESRVMSLDLSTQRLIEIENLKDTFLAKLLPVNNQSLLVIGGQSTKQRSAQSTQVKSDVTELYWNDLSKQWRVTHKDSMKTPRVGFGACFAKKKSYVVVSGGYSTGFVATKKTEIYNIAKNQWTQTSELKVSRSAHTLCEVGGGAYLYAFGGQDAEGQSLDSIERVELRSSAPLESAMGTWQVLADVKLPAALCNIGCFPVSVNEILLFGGVNAQAQEVKSGQILMCIGGSHNFLEEKIDLLIPDSFSNSSQVHIDESKNQILIQGKHAIHKLDLSNSLQRTFSIDFQQEQ